MQVSHYEDVKIYNLSAGKSLPEWLSERKRRALLKKNADIRRRIELIQDFDMPGVSTTIKVSKDGQYILATGIYKPRIKCFDVNNLSLKFERCFDSEAITFEILSDDYSKLVFLQCDRYIEFHASHGRYYRLRIPKFGRDMQYHYPSCDLFVVGASSDIYRLNLERGQFLTPYSSSASAINKCAINPVHHLLMCGTQEGRVEAWDPRSKNLVATLDCAFSCVTENKELKEFPSISALKFNGALQLGIGTATGQVLLYDIRSNKPFFTKDHMEERPIKDVDFHYQQDLVYSLDAAVLKIWNKNNGKLYTSIDASTEFNNLCLVPNSGLFFLANEDTKMQTYYIPSLGPAPKWCGFLDSLTEELEESNVENVYDDYKFVTDQELENLGLEHLKGTNLLRAYMHGVIQTQCPMLVVVKRKEKNNISFGDLKRDRNGTKLCYFIDVRLYRKAKSLVEPFEFDDYRKKKIRETIEKGRENRVQVKKLPKVNKDLALKLMSDQMKTKKKKQEAVSLLNDSRFKALFENPNFEVDKNADEYRLLNPVLSRLDKSKKKELKKKLISEEFEPVEEEPEGKNSSDESLNDFEDSESSDDEHTWTKEVRMEHRKIQREHRIRERLEEAREAEKEADKQPKLYEIRQGGDFKGVQSMKRKKTNTSLGERLQLEDSSVRILGSVGNREMIFSTRKKKNIMEQRNKKHREERKKIIRPIHGIRSTTKSTFLNKKR